MRVIIQLRALLKAKMNLQSHHNRALEVETMTRHCMKNEHWGLKTWSILESLLVCTHPLVSTYHCSEIRKIISKISKQSFLPLYLAAFLVNSACSPQKTVNKGPGFTTRRRWQTLSWSVSTNMIFLGWSKTNAVEFYLTKWISWRQFRC